MTRQRVAVFDLDHTLTRHDTFLLYLFGFLVRRPWRLLRCLHLPILVLLFYAKKLNNTQLKQRFLRAALGGVQRATLDAWTETFVERLVSNGMNGEALSVLGNHRDASDVLVLLTASLDCYVLKLARVLKFDEVICTMAEWKGDRLVGTFTSPNIRGEEKVRCMLDLKNRYKNAYFTAYADHRSDIPLLCLADRGILVNGNHQAREEASKYGLSSYAWR